MVVSTRRPRRRDWRAACADGSHDPELWWPTERKDPAREAREVCAACPVQGDCRDAFLANPGSHEAREGIWAGARGTALVTAARRRDREATRSRSAEGDSRAVERDAAQRASAHAEDELAAARRRREAARPVPVEDPAEDRSIGERMGRGR